MVWKQTLCKECIKVEQWFKISLKEKGKLDMRWKPIKNAIELDLALQCTKENIYEYDFILRKTLYRNRKQKVVFDKVIQNT